MVLIVKAINNWLLTVIPMWFSS